MNRFIKVLLIALVVVAVLIVSVFFAYKIGTDNGKSEYKKSLEVSGVINLPEIDETTGENTSDSQGAVSNENGNESNNQNQEEKIVEKIVYRDNIGTIQKVFTPFYISDRGSEGYAPKDMRLEYLVPSYFNIYTYEGYGLVGGGIVDFQSESHGTHLYLSSNPITSSSCDGIQANKCFSVNTISDIYLTFNYMPGIPGPMSPVDSEVLDTNIKPKLNNLFCIKDNEKYYCRGEVNYSESKKAYMYIYLNNNSVYEDYKRFVESLEIK